MATDRKAVMGNKKGKGQNGVFRIQIFECVMAAVCIAASLVLAGMLIYHNAFPFGILEGFLTYAVLSAMGLMMLGLNKYFSFLSRNFAETTAKLFIIVLTINFILIALLYFSRSLRLSLYYFCSDGYILFCKPL